MGKRRPPKPYTPGPITRTLQRHNAFCCKCNVAVATVHKGRSYCEPCWDSRRRGTPERWGRKLHRGAASKATIGSSGKDRGIALVTEADLAIGIDTDCNWCGGWNGEHEPGCARRGSDA